VGAWINKVVIIAVMSQREKIFVLAIIITGQQHPQKMQKLHLTLKRHYESIKPALAGFLLPDYKSSYLK
jgi:hypothetical protein